MRILSIRPTPLECPAARRPRQFAVQALVDIQIQGVDPTVSVEVRVDIVVGTAHHCTMRLLVQVQVQGVGTSVIVQIAVAEVAGAVSILVEVGGIEGKRAGIDVVSCGGLVLAISGTISDPAVPITVPWPLVPIGGPRRCTSISAPYTGSPR